LKEGTKTVFPVTYEDAVKVFDTLVLNKIKEGYTENGFAAPKTSVIKKPGSNTA